MNGLLFALRHPLRFFLLNLMVLLTMRSGVSYYHTERWQKLKRYVWERDNRCRSRGCEITRGLDTHHKKPVSQGGSWFTWNLVKLCQAHHALAHPKNAHLQDRAGKSRY